MGFTVANNFLGFCEQKGLINMGPILDGGGGCVFFSSPKHTSENPKAHATFNKPSFYP